MTKKKSIKKQVSNNIKRFQKPVGLVFDAPEPPRDDSNYGLWAFIIIIILATIIGTIVVKPKPVNSAPTIAIETNAIVDIPSTETLPLINPVTNSISAPIVTNAVVKVHHWYDFLKYHPLVKK